MRSVYFVKFFHKKFSTKFINRNFPRSYCRIILLSYILLSFLAFLDEERRARIYASRPNEFVFVRNARTKRLIVVSPSVAHARKSSPIREIRHMIDDNCAVFTMKAMRPVRYYVYVSIFPPPPSRDECTHTGYVSRIRHTRHVSVIRQFGEAEAARYRRLPALLIANAPLVHL